MKLLYVNKGASPSKFSEYLKKYPEKVQQQAQKYNQLLMEGLAENGAEVISLSSRPITRSIDSKLFFKGERETEKGIEYRYVPFINLPVARNLFVFMSVFFRVFTTRARGEKPIVVCDVLNIAASSAAWLGAKLRGFLTVGIVTDVPCYRPNNTKPSLSEKINLSLIKKFDSFLFLTENMTELVNPKNRPYIVMEGHADSSMAGVENTLAGKADKKICLYAGSLRRIYGIGNLTEGFLAANIPDTELHIYGSGDYEKELRAVAAQHDNVKYFGVAPNSVIVEEELKATLLINPRPSNEEYTKYSFPSKNMEYMASGTPVLTTRLPGMPADHLPHVYLIEDETSDGVKEALLRVFANSPEALHAFGAEAKRFILTEKSNCAQARKMLDFIQTIYPKNK